MIVSVPPVTCCFLITYRCCCDLNSTCTAVFVFDFSSVTFLGVCILSSSPWWTTTRFWEYGETCLRKTSRKREFIHRLLSSCRNKVNLQCELWLNTLITLINYNNPIVNFITCFQSPGSTSSNTTLHFETHFHRKALGDAEFDWTRGGKFLRSCFCLWHSFWSTFSSTTSISSVVHRHWGFSVAN